MAFMSLSSYNNKSTQKVLLLSRRGDSSSEWTCRIDYCYAALGDRHSSSSPKIKNFRGPLWWRSRRYHPTTTKAPFEVLLLSRRGDSNARPPRPERGALPTALLLVFPLAHEARGILMPITPRNPQRYALLCTYRYIVPPSHALGA